MVTSLPFLRWLVAHPVVLEGSTTTAFLVEHPPLSLAPSRSASHPWRGAWRANRPPPPPAAVPDVEQASHEGATGAGQSLLAAQMPGTVIRVLVEEGSRIAARTPLLVLEAMKMETPVVSPYDAIVTRLHVAEGDQVAAGAPLVELEE